MHEQVLDYFQKQHHHLEHYLALCFETPNAEVVHQLRVSIKRIRAILLFTEHLSGNAQFDAARHYKPLRKLFRLAGSIRDVQVQLKLIADCAKTLNTPFDEYLEHLDNQKKDSITLFFRGMERGKIPHNLAYIHHSINNTLTSFREEDITTRAVELLADQCSELRVRLAEAPDNEQLHQIRTIIKQMHYILDVVRKSDPSAAFPVSRKSLTAAGDLLGKWHDRIIGIRLLEAFRKMKRKHDEQETENYNLLATMLEVDQRIFRLQIRRTLTKSLAIQGN
jgi:CHAD domain-containing protein